MKTKKSVVFGTSALTVLVWALFVLSIVYAPACLKYEKPESGRIIESDDAFICKGTLFGSATVFPSGLEAISIVNARVWDPYTRSEYRKINVIIPYCVRESFFIGETGEEREVYFRLIDVKSENWYSPGSTKDTPIGLWVDQIEAKEKLEAGEWELRFPEKED